MVCHRPVRLLSALLIFKLKCLHMEKLKMKPSAYAKGIAPLKGIIILSLLFSNVLQAQELRVCRPNNMVSAFAYLAEERGFFKEEGLNVVFEETSNAKLCQDAVLAGSSDLLFGAEGPLTFLSAKPHPLRAIAITQENPETSLFVRSDREITTEADLKGKTIGYLPGTVSWFYLMRLLKKHHMQQSDLHLISLQPPAMPQALSGGVIDGFVMWEPWGYQAGLAKNYKVERLHDASVYQYIGLITAHTDTIKNKADELKRFLRAMLKTEAFMTEDSDTAISILSEKIKYSKKLLRRSWNQYHQKIFLNQSPALLMRSNFELLVELDINFKGSDIPNFNQYIDPEPLRAVAPNRVSLASR